MRPSHTLIASLFAAPIALAQAYGQTANSAVHPVAQYNLTWSSLGTSEKDLMPLGNGSLAANVWTEQNGDVVLRLSSPDAYTELGKLVKVGRVRLHFLPNVFAAFNLFTQVLRVDRSDIEMTSASNTVRIWIDANHPALHVEVHAERPTTLTFYDQHHPRDSQDKLVMVPAQSLETYQLVTVTPTPDLAGLKSVLPRMIALPQDTAGKEQVAVWQKLLAKLPEVPVGRATDKGKTPPMGVGDPHGTPVILPAAQYGKPATRRIRNYTCRFLAVYSESTSRICSWHWIPMRLGARRRTRVGARMGLRRRPSASQTRPEKLWWRSSQTTVTSGSSGSGSRHTIGYPI